MPKPRGVLHDRRRLQRRNAVREVELPVRRQAPGPEGHHQGGDRPSGAPLQTDGIAGTTDDYILELDANRRDYTDILCPVPGCPEALVVAKVDFKKGKAKVALDISSILPAALNGMPVRIRGGSLRLPPTTPAVCPGDNSAAGLMMRPEPEGCVTGAVLGMGGFVIGDSAPPSSSNQYDSRASNVAWDGGGW